MRLPLLGSTVLFLGVACSAPDEAAIFEDTSTVGTGGASSTDTTGSTSTGSNEGGAGAETSDTVGNSGTSGGSGGDTTASSAGGSTSSVGGGTGSGGSTTGTGAAGGIGGIGGTGGGASTTSTATSSGGVAGSGGGACTPTDEVCDGADNDCDDSVDDDVCPNGCVGAHFEAHSYLFCDRPPAVGQDNEPSRTWAQATNFCDTRGLRLTSVETEEENAFIYQTLVRLEVSGDVWMGATDQEDETLWSWATDEDPEAWVAFYDEEAGEPIEKAFNDWREGEPNDDGGEDCGIFEDLSSDEWAWDDRNCQEQYDMFVCESTD